MSVQQILNLSIQQFGKEPYEVIHTIPIVIQPEDGEFLASFFEANIHSSGQTDQEAYDNISSLILDTYDLLRETKEEDLGPSALRQLKVLNYYLKKVN